MGHKRAFRVRAKKYLGKDHYPHEIGERVIFKINPRKVLSYG